MIIGEYIYYSVCFANNWEGNGKRVASPPTVSMLGYNLVKHWHIGIKLSTCNLHIQSISKLCEWVGQL
jgi:hypothetical protein